VSSIIRKTPSHSPSVQGGVNLVAVETIVLQIKARANNAGELNHFKEELAEAVANLAVQRPRQKRSNVSVIEVAVDRFAASHKLL
jgi:hypothetical protein